MRVFAHAWYLRPLSKNDGRSKKNVISLRINKSETNPILGNPPAVLQNWLERKKCAKNASTVTETEFALVTIASFEQRKK